MLTTDKAVNFRSYRKKLSIRRPEMRRFLNRAEKTPFKNIDKLTPIADKETWDEVDCLSCANCCRKMTPTFTEKDKKRISRHLGMTVTEFEKKWLTKERNGDWVNVKQPCQFLDMTTYMCDIYAVRPADCAGFPHFTKRRFDEYAHVHKQNIDFCPATFKFMEKLMPMVLEAQ